MQNLLQDSAMLFLNDIIDQKIDEFFKQDLKDLINKSGKKISQDEFKRFIKDHPKLPLLKNNLQKELSSQKILKFDIILIGSVVKSFVEFFAVTALEAYERKN